MQNRIQKQKNVYDIFKKVVQVDRKQNKKVLNIKYKINSNKYIN